MHRIDTSTAGPGGSWVPGNPGIGESPTQFNHAWFQAAQEEVCHVIEQADITLEKGTNTQLLAAILAHIGAQAGGDKNAIVNGAFDVWQRGTSFAGVDDVGAWTADRWQVFADAPAGSGTATVSRRVHVVGQTDAVGAVYYLRHQQTVSATAGQPTIQTKVEDVRRYSGGVIVAFTAKASGALADVGVEVHQNFGSGGSSEVLADSDTVDLTTGFQRFTVAVTLPSISGKTVGTGSHLRIALRPPSGATYSVDISDVQLEKGAGASPFERRPLTRELALCQRYYQKSYDLDTDPGTATFVGASIGHDPSTPSVHGLTQRLSVPMLAVPTVAWYSPNDGAATAIYDITNTQNRTVTGSQYEGQQSTGQPLISPTVTNAAFAGHWTAESEL